MDDDVKTMLAIVALLYGSSNGIGLLKEHLADVKAPADKLEPELTDSRVARSIIDDHAASLLKSLRGLFVLVYVLLVLIVPVFLLLVALRGPLAVLAMIGLTTSSNPTARPSTFYWILFALSIVATIHYLHPYFKGWRVYLSYRRSKPTEQQSGA